MVDLTRHTSQEVTMARISLLYNPNEFDPWSIPPLVVIVVAVMTLGAATFAQWWGAPVTFITALVPSALILIVRDRFIDERERKRRARGYVLGD